jgi:hypothetical protein
MRRFLSPILLCLLACGPSREAAAPAITCDDPERLGELPAEVEESSGLAISRARPGVFWTHNDAGHDATLFAIDSTGLLLASIEVTGARNIDWEDIALAACSDGECLYIGDIGDNRENRETIVIYRVPEPAPGDARTAPAQSFRLRYPDQPRDAESLFVTSDARVFIISKGRSDAVGVYVAQLPEPGGVATLRLTQALTDVTPQFPQQVTGAALAPDGRTVAVRSYTSFRLYRLEGERLQPLMDEPGVDLVSLAEPQGEAIDIRSDGVVFLTSEAGSADMAGPISRVRCKL